MYLKPMIPSWNRIYPVKIVPTTTMMLTTIFFAESGFVLGLCVAHVKAVFEVSSFSWKSLRIRYHRNYMNVYPCFATNNKITRAE